MKVCDFNIAMRNRVHVSSMNWMTGATQLISRPRLTKYLTHNERDRDKGKEE